MGSSPLARGPRCPESHYSARTRLIPARAGTTAPVFGGRVGAWAHPRSRGDHFLADDFAARRWGSSPLARGPPPNDHPRIHEYGLIPARAGTTPPPYQPLVRVGLIPARAGTTPQSLPWSRSCWAHPRSRGDHHSGEIRRPSAGGSSPLARGPRL